MREKTRNNIFYIVVIGLFFFALMYPSRKNTASIKFELIKEDGTPLAIASGTPYQLGITQLGILTYQNTAILGLRAYLELTISAQGSEDVAHITYSGAVAKDSTNKETIGPIAQDISGILRGVVYTFTVAGTYLQLDKAEFYQYCGGTPDRPPASGSYTLTFAYSGTGTYGLSTSKNFAISVPVVFAWQGDTLTITANIRTEPF
jgi:hypothetical protein